jgi:hypothetical protein
MRDHRKIVFRDVTEANPFRGEALYTGMGVGQQYLGPTWDDPLDPCEGSRAARAQASARNLLLSQGISESDLPPPSASRPSPVAPVNARCSSSRTVRGLLRPPTQQWDWIPPQATERRQGAAVLAHGRSGDQGSRFAVELLLYAGLLVGACLRGTRSSSCRLALNMPSFGAPS